jgi:hypothetical protein
LVVVSHADDYVLACQPVHGKITYTAGSGGSVRQDPGLENWGPTVKAGLYRAMTVHQEWQTCFAIHDDPASLVIVFNHDVGGGLTTAHT